GQIDYREERAVLVMRRAEEMQFGVLLGIKQIPECHGQAGFADAGFAGEQDDTPFAASCLSPAPKQEFGFLLAIDERRLSGGQRLETALDAVLDQCSPSTLM